MAIEREKNPTPLLWGQKPPGGPIDGDDVIPPTRPAK